MGPFERAVDEALEAHVKDTPYGEARSRHGESLQADAAWAAMDADERFDLVFMSLSGVADAVVLLARAMDDMRDP
jgi:hypothetical protein